MPRWLRSWVRYWRGDKDIYLGDGTMRDLNRRLDQKAIQDRLAVDSKTTKSEVPEFPKVVQFQRTWHERR